tara:strand:- start:83 stop:1303 length:1221 start_codon:yes stop_codon:yes gene_type:complete
MRSMRSVSRSFRPKTQQQQQQQKRRSSPKEKKGGKQKQNQQRRPMTVAARPSTRASYNHHHHARVLLAQRQRGTQSAAQQRLSSLLVESSLRQDITFNESESTFGEVATDKEWFDSSSKDPGFRSEAIKVEILLREALIAVDNHPRPNPFRTAVAFDALTRILPHLSGFSKVMRTVSLELLASVYPKSTPEAATSFENVPFFAMAQTRGRKITQLNAALVKLQLRHDHVLNSQMASGGSINVVVLRWRRKVLNAYFNTWRTVAFVQIELKRTSARTMGNGLIRRNFANVFHAWRRVVTEELLEKAKDLSLVVVEQADDLERCVTSIKRLKEDLSEKDQEIATLKQVISMYSKKSSAVISSVEDLQVEVKEQDKEQIIKKQAKEQVEEKDEASMVSTDSISNNNTLT